MAQQLRECYYSRVPTSGGLQLPATPTPEYLMPLARSGTHTHTLGKQKQEDLSEFEDNLVYVASSRPTGLQSKA